MILMYHKIHTQIKSRWWVSPDTFYQQMLDLYKYKVVYLDDYDPSDEKHFVITFDDAYGNILEYAAPILEMLKFPFEVFVIGKCINNNYIFESSDPLAKFATKEQLLEIIQAGGRLQWHTMSHNHLGKMKEKEIFDEELSVPDELRYMCPEGFKWFAYPYGESNDEYKSEVSKYFSGGLGVDDGKANDIYNLKRTTIYEDTQLSDYLLADEKAKDKLDNKNMKLSVIIPVYNADRFLSKAVESALEQAETAEIVLVEDGSPDDSLAVCNKLVRKYENVHLVRHPYGKNMGASASRNLGINYANCEFIAFLDADDFYLTDRFKVAKKIFNLFPDCDGVYEATGRYIENEDGLTRWRMSGRPMCDLLTVWRHTSADNLGKLLIIDQSNCISPDGLVLKRNALKKSGLMDIKLRLHQDTEFMIRLAIACKLMPGRLYKPSSIWRLHEKNRISSHRSKEQQLYDEKAVWDSLHNWSKKNNYKIENKLIENELNNYHELVKKLNCQEPKNLILTNLMEELKVTVIVPFYKSINFLEETIESVLSQTYTNWELLLVDDGSTDGSKKIALSFEERFPGKIKYLHHQGFENKGTSIARNLGLRNSSGDYVVFLDSDDILLKEKLETQVGIFKKHPEVDVTFHGTLFWFSWSEQNKSLGEDYIWEPWVKYNIPTNTIIRPPTLVKTLLMDDVMPCIHSLLIRRNILEHIDGWSEDITNMFDDQAFWLKLFMHGNIYISAGCYEKYRIHENSMCAMAEKEGRTQNSRINYLKWAKIYLKSQNFRDHEIEHYLDKALKPYANLMIKKENEPPLSIGLKDFGDLHRLNPVSLLWGFDRGNSSQERGQPIDRFYIENFLERHSEDIKGHVLEIGDSGYTLKYGGEWVTSANVLDADPSNHQANYIYDLAVGGDGFPQEVFDCFILTQTLLLIYDVKSAIQSAYKTLKPGGVLLVTLPGISQICRPEMELWGDYWRFTDASVRGLFGEVFGEENITVETFGNVLSATAFLYGLSSQEIKREELEYNDPNYQVTITLRAVKPERGYRESFETDKEELSRLQAELGGIYNSRAWKLILFYRHGREQLRQLDLRGKKKFKSLANPFLIYSKKVYRRLKLISEARLIRSSGFFDDKYYLTNHPDVAKAKFNPAYHYLMYGGFEGRNPGHDFDSAMYLNDNNDVREAGINPLNHYLKFGRHEGRSAKNNCKQENLGE